MSTSKQGTALISRSDIRRLLPIADCIAAVEAAFAASTKGGTIPAGALGTHVAHGGFHVKTAGLSGAAPYFAAKVNANFPGNPSQSGLPTIQGLLVLFDATNGIPLAVMDAAEITRLRTAAATAVAAKYLSRADASTATICGCGLQGRANLEALCSQRRITRVFAYDRDAEHARAFAKEMAAAHDIVVTQVSSIREGSTQSDVVITCTTSQEPILSSDDVENGTFIAAVGADSEHKQEIHPLLMKRAAVVVDVLAQCAAFGDLHHAIAAGVMTEADVRADLAGIIVGSVTLGADEVVVFDSTGTALEDVAAAALVYERAVEHGRLSHFDFVR